MNFTVEELVKATNAELIKSTQTSEKFSISTDSRTVCSGQIYLPLKGEKFDGAIYIESAVKNGANGYFVSDKALANVDADNIFLVKDTKLAYLEIARFFKKKISPKTIAITGSSGKTTTKEMMASVCEENFKTHKSILNHNNEIGLCQTLLSMPEDTEVLIVEMGMRGLGEIELLSTYAEPDIAIIANAGVSHIGRLGSLENIAKAKCEIASHLNENGILIAHDNPLIKKQVVFSGKVEYFSLKEKSLKEVVLHTSSSSFNYKGANYRLNIEGEHNIQNALGVINVALYLGMTPVQIAKGLVNFKQIEKRWEVEKIKGYSVINDAYNANPDSMKAAIKTFLVDSENRKVLVLGDMGELGLDEEKYHSQIGDFLKDLKYDYLLTFGNLARLIEPSNDKKNIHFESKNDIAKYIMKNVEKGAEILVKASRSMKFEEIIEELKKL